MLVDVARSEYNRPIHFTEKSSLFQVRKRPLKVTRSPEVVKSSAGNEPQSENSRDLSDIRYQTDIDQARLVTATTSLSRQSFNQSDCHCRCLAPLCSCKLARLTASDIEVVPGQRRSDAQVRNNIYRSLQRSQ